MPELRETDLFDNLFERLFDGVCVLDRNGTIVLWNGAAERITGHRASSLVGKRYQDSTTLHLGDDGADTAPQQHLALATLKDGLAREGRGYFKHADGFRQPVAMRTIPIRDANGKVAGSAAIFSDNKVVLAALQNVQTSDATILFDPLTGIGNRPHIELKVRMALHAYVGGGMPFGVLFLDIDHFKDFNDTYGHLTGDKVLRYVAQSIRNNLRVSDSCGRWGGEEFIAVLMDVDEEGLTKVAEKLRQAIANTEVEDQGQRHSVTVSIGGTMVRPDDTHKTLIQRVDELMYQSKQGGRNRVTVED
jgi:diguanylate cyclase (GGDEF)-like protein/PAS domain S-box-containing protein